MTYEEITAMMQETGLPCAYHHFAEGESPPPPFVVYLSPGEHTLHADNINYYSGTVHGYERSGRRAAGGRCPDRTRDQLCKIGNMDRERTAL